MKAITRAINIISHENYVLFEINKIVHKTGIWGETFLNVFMNSVLNEKHIGYCWRLLVTYIHFF